MPTPQLSNEDDQSARSVAGAQTALDGSLRKLARLQQTGFVKKLLEQVKAHESLLVESNFPRRLAQLGQRLCASGYTVVLRTRHGGGNRKDCLKNMPHVHLVAKDHVSYREFIVETAFRSHFSIPWASTSYNRTLDKIPEVFVGDRHTLEEIAEAMSKEMVLMFVRMNRVIPPWRNKESILLKWSAQGSHDRELQDVSVGHDPRVMDPKCSAHWSWPDLHHAQLIPAGINPIVGFF